MDDDSLFGTALRFVRTVVMGLSFSGRRTRVSVMTFYSTPIVHFWLDTYSTQVEVVNALSLVPRRGRTNIADSLTLATDQVFSRGRGDRIGTYITP